MATKQQKAATITAWIARDDNRRLFLYTDKPERKELVFTSKSGHCAELPMSLFQQIPNDSTEAVEVELSIVITKNEKK